MAASNNNITAVHFSLIFFVMTTIIFGVVSYLKINEADEARKTASASKAESDKDKSTNNTTSEVALRVLREMGYPVGVELTDAYQESTLAAMKADHDMVLKLYGDHEWATKYQLTRPGNIREDLMMLKIAYDRMRSDKNTSIAKLTVQKDAAVAARVQAETEQTRLAGELKTVKESVEKIKEEHKEKLDAKQREVERLAAAERQLKVRLDTQKEAHANEIALMKKKVENLLDTVARKQREIDEIKQVSFERPDGVIRKVDYRTKLAWIDLGSADRLPNRLNFSVYSASHHGVGRGREDIKGAIEVTRITGAHLAEVRIVDYDIYNPIRAGDPIYTPLWNVGSRESFAFVGFVDLDGDGKSDRDVLYRLVAAAGAKISNAVDDKGDRTGLGLTTDDKFLVKGRIFDPDKADRKEETEKRKKIAKAALKIEEEAREKGIRVIRVADFVEYIGLKTNRRLWRPGEGSPRKLKAGAASTTVNETIGNRQSTGRTSGVYSRSKRLKQPKSTGQTSGSYNRP